MRVLVTGPTGFVGKHVVRALSNRGHELGLLVRDAGKADALKAPDSVLLEGDLDGAQSLKGLLKDFAPQACVHLAWEGIPDYSAAVSKRNLDRSLHLADLLAAETPCKKIVVSGSCFEYGKTRGVCAESDPVQTASYIAWAKQALYNYLTLLGGKSSLRTVWFRFFYVYGPGQRSDSLIPTIVRSLMKGEMPDVRNPYNANDFVYIEDVAEAIRLGVEKDPDSGVYNLGSGRATSILDVCRLIERELPGRGEFSERLSARRPAEEPAGFWADISKAKKVLGWEPKRSLPEGIRRYVDSMAQRSAA